MLVSSSSKRHRAQEGRSEENCIAILFTDEKHRPRHDMDYILLPNIWTKTKQDHHVSRQWLYYEQVDGFVDCISSLHAKEP